MCFGFGLSAVLVLGLVLGFGVGLLGLGRNSDRSNNSTPDMRLITPADAASHSLYIVYPRYFRLGVMEAGQILENSRQVVTCSMLEFSSCTNRP